MVRIVACMTPVAGPECHTFQGPRWCSNYLHVILYVRTRVAQVKSYLASRRSADHTTDRTRLLKKNTHVNPQGVPHLGKSIHLHPSLLLYKPHRLRPRPDPACDVVLDPVHRPRSVPPEFPRPRRSDFGAEVRLTPVGRALM